MSAAPLTLTLVRHGATDWNAEGRWQGWTDTPLGTLGQTQARQLARRLAGHRFDAAYASDLSRALRTAEIILPSVVVTRDARLRELNFGQYEGATRETIQNDPRYAAWQMDPWTLPAPGGESLLTVADRLQAWAEELPGGQVVAVSHGAAIRALLCALFGWPATPQPGYVLPFAYRLAHTGLTRLSRREGRWTLHTYNDHAHLDGGD
ncbi:histidine phosphatase family protein [Deinococcus aerophilus]|uniref:Phosphoglycerate mutase n=1 Tax=Deinococcus aerophilus TaxID=522488 RepID=A0ABQ2GMG6_9DEIO|nr:histidine phosphatase family protein [Deinococcus aerophilus]GGM03771.1 phosphoglycerate mutase [Deinococcus aerophilus]